MTQDPRVARRQVVILNALGLHMRPAEKFVALAKKFQSEVLVIHGDQELNGKSILNLTMLAAEQGVRLDLEARGPDADAALAALAELVSARFHENDDGSSREYVA